MDIKEHTRAPERGGESAAVTFAEQYLAGNVARDRELSLEEILAVIRKIVREDTIQ